MRPSLQQIVDRFRRLRPAAGTRAQVAIELRPAAIMAARVEGGRLTRTQHQPCRPDQRREQLERMRRTGWFDGAQTYLVLGTGQRQLVSTARPPVPDEELRDALRWQLRDALDYPPDEAVIDPLPVASTEPSGREEVLVFAVRRGELAPLVRTLVDAGVTPDRVSVIDCAQRNLARHWVAQAGVTALLAPVAGGLLCTVSQGEELILSRAIEVEPDLTDGSAQMTQAAERIALQLQRTLDLLERRSADAAVTMLLVADWGPAAPLLRRVAALAGPRAMALPIEQLLGPDEARASVRADAPHEFVHLLGACLMEAPVEAPVAGPQPFDAATGTAPVVAPDAPVVDAVADAGPGTVAAASPALVFADPVGTPGPAESPAGASPTPSSAALPALAMAAPEPAPAATELPALEPPASAVPRRRADGPPTTASAPRPRTGAAVPRRAASGMPAAPAGAPEPASARPAMVPQAPIDAPAPTSAGSFLLVDPAAALAAELARSVAAARATTTPPAETATDATASGPVPAPATPGRLELLP